MFIRGLGGVTAAAGDKLSPEALSTAYLSALNNHLMYTLEQKLGASILRTIPIEYCLTVPAIWSEVAKEKTLQAARKAGLKGVGNIMLVSEPVSSRAANFERPLIGF
jgi:molecular chaperone DnaK (HSP70)